MAVADTAGPGPPTVLSLRSFTSTLALNDPLQTLFQLMSGRMPQAATVPSTPQCHQGQGGWGPLAQECSDGFLDETGLMVVCWLLTVFLALC